MDSEDDKQVVWHLKYYEDTGNVILRIGNTLYKLDRNALAQKSGFFSTIFSLPVPENCQEGLSDEKPIKVPEGVTPEEFDNLMITCINVEWTQPPHPIQRFRDVLKLSALWDFPAWTKEMAVFNLLTYSITEFPPPERLYLARRYDIPEFVDSAMRELCRKDPANSLGKLTLNEVQQIGLSAFEVIAKVKEAIQTDRCWIAFHAPKLGNAEQDPGCGGKKHALCELAWKKAWWNQIGRLILQPADLISLNLPRDGEEAIMKITAAEMTPGCLASIKKWVVNEGRFKTLEKSRVDMGISEVLTRLEKGEL